MNPATSDAPAAASSLPQRATRSRPAGLPRRSIGYRSRSTTSARPLTGTPPHPRTRGHDQSGSHATCRASTQRPHGMTGETTGRAGPRVRSQRGTWATSRGECAGQPDPAWPDPGSPQIRWPAAATPRTCCRPAGNRGCRPGHATRSGQQPVRPARLPGRPQARRQTREAPAAPQAHACQFAPDREGDDIATQRYAEWFFPRPPHLKPASPNVTDQPMHKAPGSPNRRSRTVRCKRHIRHPYQPFWCALRSCPRQPGKSVT
jgi:hypothetical protein